MVNSGVLLIGCNGISQQSIGIARKKSAEAVPKAASKDWHSWRKTFRSNVFWKPRMVRLRRSWENECFPFIGTPTHWFHHGNNTFEQITQLNTIYMDDFRMPHVGNTNVVGSFDGL